jgi:O-acetyl-ADP-ribose deacetylase (regulator of RNase III)
MAARIRLVEGDITAQRADAIVNAANSRMRGGGGVDGAIHRTGGPEILADCVRRFPDGLAVGRAGWTVAGDLPAQWVIHVVGPNWNAGQRDPGLLESCYREALRVADELGARTVAFPAVSAGIYGWPVEDAARIAIRTVATAETEVQEAVFVLFGQNMYAVFAASLQDLETQS